MKTLQPPPVPPTSRPGWVNPMPLGKIGQPANFSLCPANALANATEMKQNNLLKLVTHCNKLLPVLICYKSNKFPYKGTNLV